MSAIKIKTTQFQGLAKVFSRESDGLANIVRGLAIDNARARLLAAGPAIASFTDDTGGGGMPGLLPFPTAAIDATTAGGAQLTALNASLVKMQNAGLVATNTINAALTLLGLPLLVSASGAQAAANTLPTQDLTSTAANGVAAANYVTTRAAFEVAALNLQALVNGANAVFNAIGGPAPMFRAAEESGYGVGNLTLAAIPAAVAVAVGPSAIAKSDADAFLTAYAKDLAALAYAWNAVITGGNDDLLNAPLLVVAG